MHKYLTLKDVREYNFQGRFTRKYNITTAQLSEILYWLDNDWTLGRYKYHKGSIKTKKLFNVDITPRQLRYMHKIYLNLSKLYKQLKKGGKIYGNRTSLIHHGV